jgi:hypothetical protein
MPGELSSEVYRLIVLSGVFTQANIDVSARPGEKVRDRLL